MCDDDNGDLSDGSVARSAAGSLFQLYLTIPPRNDKCLHYQVRDEARTLMEKTDAKRKDVN